MIQLMQTKFCEADTSEQVVRANFMEGLISLVVDSNMRVLDEIFDTLWLGPQIQP